MGVSATREGSDASGNPIRASIVPIAILYWASFVILTSVSGVLRGYDYGWINLPLDASIILYATVIGVAIARLLSSLTPLPFARQALIALAGIALFTFVFDTGFQLIRSTFGPQAATLTISNALTVENIVRGGLFWFVPLCLWSASMLALLNNEKARRQERQLLIAESQTNEQRARAAEAETKATRLELATLRLQLNPHFMCNSLNGISSLILSGRVDDADAVISSLADFLRSSLDTSDREIPLAQEIETARAYLKVEAIRFGERMQVAFDCSEEAMQALVPNFILQPLVENAIKYGVGGSSGAVHIKIAARREGERLLVSVQDDGNAAAPQEGVSSGGVGLANTRARLQIRYGDEASLETAPTETGYRSTLRLPYRK